MSHWTIGRKLYLGVGALVALVLLISGIALWSASNIFGRLRTDGEQDRAQTGDRP